MGEMLASPTRRSRSRSHAGEVASARTPRITREQKIGQLLADSMRTGKTESCTAATGNTACLEIAVLVSGGVIACDPEDAHAIAAVRGGVHLEHGIVEIERLAHVDIERQRCGQLHDPVMLLAQAQLARRAQHAVRFHAADLRALDGEAAGKLGSHLGDGHLQPRAHVRRTADDAQAILTVGRHLAQRQLVRIGMAAALEDLAHDDPAERRRDGRDRLDLEPG